MAKEEAPAEEPKTGKDSKKMIIIIVVVVVVLALAGVGAFFALSGGKSAEEGVEEGEEEAVESEEAEGHEAAPAVLPLESFIVNLQVKG
ncbi:MAG TPA: flagellar protein, partial [Oligoflexia bacterium]|nr:flagellar protein [Oligoflexia bacterium]